MNPDHAINVTTGFGANTHVGFVQMERPDDGDGKGWMIQLRAETAAALAMNLLQAAEAARGEHALWRICERMELPDLMPHLLGELRSLRLIETEQGR